ncbi:hypothetical protein U91I_01831 [alpha proteobacterium U9-1i]|nr:hypothetical protein U91I_01831 [alpha proteobacterium U9-1i]
MRAWIVASAAALTFAVSACDGAVETNGGAATPDPSGYTLEIRASNDEQLYLVTAPDGTSVGARAAGGASALMDASGIRQFTEAAPPEPMSEEVMSFRAPGVNFAISGDPDADGEGGGAVAINIGGQSINVNAQEGGETGDRAHVRIAGVSAQDARDFIAEADELSPDVQSQMLAALNLQN